MNQTDVDRYRRTVLSSGFSRELDPVILAEFFEACCVTDPVATVLRADLYARYFKWSVADRKPVADRVTFGRLMNDVFKVRTVRRMAPDRKIKTYYYIGLSLKKG